MTEKRSLPRGPALAPCPLGPRNLRAPEREAPGGAGEVAQDRRSREWTDDARPETRGPEAPESRRRGSRRRSRAGPGRARVPGAG